MQKLLELCAEAADHIEDLSRYNRVYRKRMDELEAALRKIAADRAFYTSDTYIEYQNIARHALEEN